MRCTRRHQFVLLIYVQLATRMNCFCLDLPSHNPIKGYLSRHKVISWSSRKKNANKKPRGSSPGSKGGFAKPTTMQQAPQLEAEAASCLDKAGGSIDMAQALYMNAGIERLRASDPSLFAELEGLSNAQKKQLVSEVEHQKDLSQSPRAHAKLVELTWDAVAAYLPLEASTSSASQRKADSRGKPKGTSNAVRAKLTAIAKACTASAVKEQSQPLSVLDVGCGDGAILPFLRAAGGVGSYVGVDLSGQMIAAAKNRFVSKSGGEGGLDGGDASGDMSVEFLQAGFDDIAVQAYGAPKVTGDEGGTGGSAPGTRAPFDVVLFNGSLQFFDDHSTTLCRAFSLLQVPAGKKGEEGDSLPATATRGRVIVTHANGAAFVRAEHQGSPLVAVKPLPAGLAACRALAAEVGGGTRQHGPVAVLGPRELGLLGARGDGSSNHGAADEEEDTFLEDFYLVAFDALGDTAEEHGCPERVSDL
mmetsp:Transcript_10055/g.18465  ORF Transcript_10055/g.18465 Transcript_10055/m.18465 type:complete len:474 (+) Transcript_10055:412-1833(+)